jgi:hypothetical protein
MTHKHVFQIIRIIIIATTMIVCALVGSSFSMSSFLAPEPFQQSKEDIKKSILGVRSSWMWGCNTQILRDGDNANNGPGKKEITLNSPVFGLVAGTFLGDDTAVRGQAWINVPLEWSNEFYLDFEHQSNTYSGPVAWKTKPQAFQADLSAIYFFDMNYTPYKVGLVGGYKYSYFSFASHRAGSSSTTFHDHFHIHVPYTGVYYAHDNLLGFITRLDLAWSPVLVSQIDSEYRQSSPGQPRTSIDAQSLTGLYLEMFFEISKKVSESSIIGAFFDIGYFELNAGATVKSTGSDKYRVTNFSLDSYHTSLLSGLSLTYRF